MLYYNTINEVLTQSLLQLMAASEFDSFRLVGGTSLSLRLGHRMSVDIDLFSDAPYVKLDVFYSDPFMQPLIMQDSIRLATVDEIVAMKIDVVQRGGRKKDFFGSA